MRDRSLFLAATALSGMPLADLRAGEAKLGPLVNVGGKAGNGGVTSNAATNLTVSGNTP